MAILGERFTAGRHRAEEVRALMGAPDETMVGGADHHGTPVPPGRTLLIYRWRGGHDYLYFVVSGGVIESARWYHAGE